jgi:hypothetical protein
MSRRPEYSTQARRCQAAVRGCYPYACFHPCLMTAGQECSRGPSAECHNPRGQDARLLGHSGKPPGEQRSAAAMRPPTVQRPIARALRPVARESNGVPQPCGLPQCNARLLGHSGKPPGEQRSAAAMRLPQPRSPMAWALRPVARMRPKQQAATGAGRPRERPRPFPAASRATASRRGGAGPRGAREEALPPRRRSRTTRKGSS